MHLRLAIYFILVATMAFLAFRDWAYDDAFITYRYAANLLNGQGFVYNPGLRVLSTTTPLYAMTLALLGSFWPNLPTLSNFISALSLAAGGLLLWRLACSWHSREVGALVLLLYPLSPLLYSTFGGEMLFYIALCLGCFVCWVERRYLWAALLAALAVLTRGDAIVLVILLALAHLVGRSRRPPWPALAIFISVIATWVVFAYSYYGSPLPVTLLAKRSQGQMAISPSFLAGLADVLRQYASYWTYWIEALLLLAGLLYVIVARRLWLLFLAWPVLYAMAYVVLGIPRYFWYYAPLVTGTAVCVSLGLVACSRAVGRWPALRRAEALARLVTAALVSLLVVSHGSELWRLRQHSDPRLGIYRAAGLWLRENTVPSATVGTLEVGIIGYYCQRPMVDFAGLIQPEVARQLDYQTTYEVSALWAIEHYRPQYLVLNPAWFPSLLNKEATSGCREVQRFPGEEYGYDGALTIYHCG